MLPVSSVFYTIEAVKLPIVQQLENAQSVNCIWCEISKAKDYSFTFLAKLAKAGEICPLLSLSSLSFGTPSIYYRHFIGVVLVSCGGKTTTIKRKSTNGG